MQGNSALYLGQKILNQIPSNTNQTSRSRHLREAVPRKIRKRVSQSEKCEKDSSNMLASKIAPLSFSNLMHKEETENQMHTFSRGYFSRIPSSATLHPSFLNDLQTIRELARDIPGIAQ